MPHTCTYLPSTLYSTQDDCICHVLTFSALQRWLHPLKRSINLSLRGRENRNQEPGHSDHRIIGSPRSPWPLVHNITTETTAKFTNMYTNKCTRLPTCTNEPTQPTHQQEILFTTMDVIQPNSRTFRHLLNTGKASPKMAPCHNDTRQRYLNNGDRNTHSRRNRLNPEQYLLANQPRCRMTHHSMLSNTVIRTSELAFACAPTRISPRCTIPSLAHCLIPLRKPHVVMT